MKIVEESHKDCGGNGGVEEQLSQAPEQGDAVKVQREAELQF